MNKELLLLRKLVSFNTDSSTKSNYSECASFIKHHAEHLGFKARVVDGSSECSDGLPRPNLVIEHDAGASETLVLATHYDVVPAGDGWKTRPFELHIAGEKAFGRGTCDDKSNIVACLAAMRDLKKSKASKLNIKLLVTCDEEVGGDCGLGYLVNKLGVKADAAVIVDAAPELTIAASGVVFGRITVRGRQGHAGYPHLAKNAIYSSFPLLGEMKKFSRIREKHESAFKAEAGAPKKRVWGRFSITTIHSGDKENTIPGELEAGFDMRLLPEEEPESAKRELFKFFESAKLKAQADADITITALHEGYYTDEGSKLVSNFKRVFGHGPVATLGGNDGRFFAGKGIPVVSFGTIRPECNPHGANEFVYLDDMELVRHVLYGLCANWK